MQVRPCHCARGRPRNSLTRSAWDTGPVHWYCKHWWAAIIARAGFTSIFLDNDAVAIKNPLEHLSRGHFDLEGLSDFLNPDALPKPLVHVPLLLL